MSLKNLNVSHVYTRTLPVVTAPNDPNRVVWDSSADQLWAKMREGKPFIEETQQSTDNGNQDSSNNDANQQDSADQNNAQQTPQNNAQQTP